MDFKNAKGLLELCDELNAPISEIMRRRECEEGESTLEDVQARMRRVWEIMKDSATQPLTSVQKSMGGLIGGEARRLADHRSRDKGICGDVLGKAITYAMAVLEVNSTMGLIVAAPTAGSSGVVPGLLLALRMAR